MELVRARTCFPKNIFKMVQFNWCVSVQILIRFCFINISEISIFISKIFIIHACYFLLENFWKTLLMYILKEFRRKKYYFQMELMIYGCAHTRVVWEITGHMHALRKFRKNC